jgi:opacity protein-like surface antigen
MRRLLQSLVSATLLALAFAPAASAQNKSVWDDFGVYVGGAIGMAHDSGDYGYANTTVTRQDFTGPGAKIYVGLRMFRYFGVEAAYARIATTSVDGVTGSNQPFSDRYTHEALPVSVVGFLPLGERWELNARLGIVANSSYETGGTCYTRTRSGAVRQHRCSETPIAVGLGARYAFNGKWGARLDYDLYQLRDGVNSPRSDLSLFSLGIDYRF